MMQCPCQSNLAYSQCCRIYHIGKAPMTAEALMRARYSAYVLADSNFLHRTWHPNTRPSKRLLQQRDTLEWLGLAILRIEGGQVVDNAGLVEFVATYRVVGQSDTLSLHENSQFIKEQGKWLYVQGEHSEY